MFSIDEILKAVDGRVQSTEYRVQKIPIPGISIDSRTIKKGELFVAIKGKRFDGHAFVEKAHKNGAWGAVVSGAVRSKDTPLIKVKDTLEALGDIAEYHRQRFDIPAIGITGSNGKTTVKEMVSQILGRRYSVLKNIGTQNNLIGLPLTLLRLKTGRDIMALEMGMNRFGEIRRLAEILKPDVGIITNIGPSHLDILKDKDGVLRAKSELVDALKKEGMLILNGDDPMLGRINPRCKIVKFGLGIDNDFRASDIKFDNGMTHFVLNGRYPIKMRPLGSHNIYNALAAIAAAAHFKIDIKDTASALLAVKVPHMRMELEKINGISVINDAYNSNPLSLGWAIKTFSDFKTKGRKILITGDMLELGKASGLFHKEAGRRIAESSIDWLITVGEHSRETAVEANRAGFSKERLRPCGHPKEAARVLRRIVKNGDAVLVKGSRAMAMERVIEGLSNEATTYGLRA